MATYHFQTDAHSYANHYMNQPIPVAEVCTTKAASPVRSTLGVAALVLLLGVIAFQSGLADRLVIARFQTLSREVHMSEWDNQWLGVTLQQYPSDLMVYQNLVHKLKPDLIIETGTHHGGSALYLSTLLNVVNPQGRIVSVDIDATHWKRTLETLNVAGQDELLKRITFLEGSSTAPEIIEQIAAVVPADGTVLVILDSDHSRGHVLRELELYSKFVNVGSYLIVNDTQWGAPLEAVEDYLATVDTFQVDTELKKFLVSCAHGGILKRVATGN
jgi:cephalosporin hydroxylase